MPYAGGKAKLGLEIAEVIARVADLLNYNDSIIVPFAGFLGVSRFLVDFGFKIKANDANSDIIAMWKSLKSGRWKLPSRPVSKEDYLHLKEGYGLPEERGFFGVACAYSGIPFAGYRIRSEVQNFFQQTTVNVERALPSLSKISFSSKDYRTFLRGIENKIIYCDPPYMNNNFKTAYFEDFDSVQFWREMRILSKKNVVLISEYEAPPDFEPIWEHEVSYVYSGKKKKKTEKLFIYEKMAQRLSLLSRT